METVMRKMILMLALAGVATPALAEPQDGWAEQRQERAAEAPRAEQQQERVVEAPRAEQRQERVLEAPRAEQPREVRMGGEARGGGWQRPEAAQAPQAPQPERAMRGSWNRGDDGVRAAAQAPDAGQVARWRERQEQNRAQQASEGTVPATRWSDHVRQAPSGSWNQPPVQGQAAPVVRYGNRDCDQRQWTGTHDSQRTDGRYLEGQRDGPRWSSSWRRDPRYDWQRYRSHNRSIFRVGNYYDPFGWGYRRLSIGFTLYSGYYQSNYWLDDPWQYRLPPVYGPYRWVRYYDDAVLVNIYTGQVVDVISGFFW